MNKKNSFCGDTCEQSQDNPSRIFHCQNSEETEKK